jgi:hypothetical protein
LAFSSLCLSKCFDKHLINPSEGCRGASPH